MNRPVLTASLAATLWLALGSTSAVRAETTTTDPAPAATPVSDVQDLIYLGDERPVFIRLHVQVEGGKSFAAVWDDYLRAMIKYMDRDGDGVLNESEARFVPSAPMMVQAQQNGFFVGQNGGARFADLKRDAQATTVSFEDLKEYYRKAGVGSVRVTAPQQNRRGNSLTDALFKALDTNGDGKLSRAEVLAAEKTLQKLDADDDEMISTAEVLGITGGQPQFIIQGMAPPATSLPVVGVEARGDLTALGARIVSHYDRDKNQKLSREEIGLDAATFEKLDLNRDSALDATEVLGLLRLDPLVELTIRLGKVDLDEKAVRSVKPMTPNMRASAEGMMVTLGNAQIDFARRMEAPATASNYRQFYLQQFRAADKKKRGFVEVADLDNRQSQFLKPLMPLIDRDGDGKLTEKELTDYLDLQAQVTTTTFSIQVGEGGQGLFELLDADRDGRLSAKELRTAWDRLAAWDQNNDGHIARGEISRQLDVTVLRGPAFGRNRTVIVMSSAAQGPRAPTKGPLWFRKMDRNADGVLSPREFLGTAEDFKKLDTDGDGFIDAAEAEKAGEVLGKRADAKP